jgi:NAD(P)-dependent dehydrogenase (short-subunit alcohol dehydrogenase family)
MKKVAVITGCNGGIGRATCDFFVEKGWKVIGLDIKNIDYELDNFEFIQCDISKIEEIARVRDLVKEKENQVDALVNNAAVQICKPFTEMSLEDWDKVMDVNLKAPYFLVQQLYPFLKATKGAVVNVSSVHAIATSANISIYALSKGGLTTLTRALAIECAKDVVRVNAILPGAVDTSMLRDGLRRGHFKGDTDDDLVRAIGLKHLIGRVGEPQEIAQAIYYLADSSQSSFITGQSIVIDGGATIKLSTE